MTGFAVRTAFSRRKGNLKSGYGVLREPKDLRFRFIEEHRLACSIGRMCRVMDVSTRGLRAFQNSPSSRSPRSDMVTLAHIHCKVVETQNHYAQLPSASTFLRNIEV
ncbi:hypothetical protein A8B74_00770 [Sulfitobacter geojensis]|nr:hypothetical protein A8B74_00770 [Sulfitobacter geojensis]